MSFFDLGMTEEEQYAKLHRPPTNVKIVCREEWGAATAKKYKKLNLPIKKVSFTVDTGTPPCSTMEECRATVRKIQARHMVEENMPDIAYNFLVGSDGNVYEGRGWYLRPQKYLLDPDCLDRTIDIAYIGKYGFPDTQYPWTLYDTACELMLEGQDRRLLVHNPHLLYPDEEEEENKML